jgi:hypothetical protein
MIGVTTVSTGTEGHETPTGIFTILQKELDHKSNLYDDAPMPFMQRLTWDGVAMHAGKLPGYPASHGCIRLPAEFAKLLYRTTSKGMTVIITDNAPVPRLAPSPSMLQTTALDAAAEALGSGLWRPELAPQGPVSVIISAADSRLVVLRNGVEIGSSRVRIKGSVSAPSAFVLRAIDAAGPHWLALPLPWKSTASDEKVTAAHADRISIPEDFRRRLVEILEAGVRW